MHLQEAFMDFIKGADREQITFLPPSIEEYVSDDNPVRVIDAYIEHLDFEALGFSKHRPNETGRPMYDPKDLLKLYVYGYMNRIRSSRRLEREAVRNLEVIWLVRKIAPDHKTIARFRHDNSVALKNVFRNFVQLCIGADLYGRELVAIDGSKFRAVNASGRNYNRKNLDERIARINARIEEYLNQIDETDNVESKVSPKPTPEEIKRIVDDLTVRKDKYQSYIDRIEETGAHQLSVTDPDSRRMVAQRGRIEVCYNIQASVDEKNKMIVDFSATNSVNDKNLLYPEADSARCALGVDSLTVLADAGYESATDAAKCIRDKITPHIVGLNADICLPVESTETKPIEDYQNGRTVYLPERNIAVCPMGKVLYPKYYRKRGAYRIGIYANLRACKICNRKCTPAYCYKFEIEISETQFSNGYDDTGLNLEKTVIFSNKALLKRRKAIVEHVFGTIKRTMDSSYCLTRGLGNVSGEFSLTFLVYNLKRAINILGTANMVKMIAKG
jgi:transposase